VTIVRLIAADLVDSWRVWLGALAVSIAASLGASVPGVLVVTGLNIPGVPGIALLSIAGTVLAFTVVAVVVVLTSVMRLTVSLLAPTYALWQLAGVTPGTVAVTLMAQLAVVAAAGGTIGAALGAMSAPPLVTTWLHGAVGLSMVRPISTPAGSFGVAVVTTVIAMLAGIGAAVRAGRTPPVAVMRTDEGVDRRGRTVVRVLLVATLSALALQMILTIPGALQTGAAQALLVGPVLIAAVAVAGTAVTAPVGRWWTALVPERSSVSFAIARATVAWSGTRSATAVAALVVAIGLPSALVAGQRTLATVLGEHASGTGTTSLVLGGPVLLAAVGAAATVFMAGRDRGREQRLLATVGATPAFGVAVAALEGVILLVTAAVVATGVVAVVSVAEWIVLIGGHPTARPVLPVAELVLVTAVCAPLVIAAAVVPSLGPGRKATRRAAARRQDGEVREINGLEARRNP
jgi:putative ABC transport system permease protein